MKTRLLLVTTLTTASILFAPPVHAQTATPTPTATPTGYVDAFRVTPSAPLAERQSRTATRLGQRMVAGEAQLLMNFRALYNEVWQNADGLTPQQVCDALGNRASALFIIAGTMANALYQIDPAGLGTMIGPPTGWTSSINADGTVTLTHGGGAGSPTPTPTP